jgi:hypothetical protein
VLSLNIFYWHAANAMNFLIMKLHKANIVPACVQLAMRQNLCILHLPMLNATIQELLSGTKHYQNDMIECLPGSQDNCDSGGMPPMAIGAQVATPHDEAVPHLRSHMAPLGCIRKTYRTYLT